MSYFFNMISSSKPMIYVVLIWAANILIIIRGAKSIEAVVKIFVPLMWVMMIVLIIRGITLPGGLEGILFLFTPDFSVMGDVGIWKGAFSQMFFTLSLGFGIMMAYASYLPTKNDDVSQRDDHQLSQLQLRVHRRVGDLLAALRLRHRAQGEQPVDDLLRGARGHRRVPGCWSASSAFSFSPCCSWPG